jgi:hypothetical protein
LPSGGKSAFQPGSSFGVPAMKAGNILYGDTDQIKAWRIGGADASAL